MQAAYVATIFLNGRFFGMPNFALSKALRAKAESSVLRALRLFAESPSLLAGSMPVLPEEAQLMAAMRHIIPGRLFTGAFGDKVDKAWKTAQPAFVKRNFDAIPLHLL
jgi:hypothetical protein